MYLTFSNPNALFFLFMIPALIFSHFYFLKKNKVNALRFANYETLKRIKGEDLITKNLTHLVIRCVVLLLLVLTLSGASFNYLTEVSQVDFVIAIDSSPSMTTADYEVSRFQVAKEYAEEFISATPPNTGIGLVSFGGVTFITQPLTYSKLSARTSLFNMQVLPSGGADFSNAIITSTNLLINSNNSRAILLISDGLGTISPLVSDPVMEASNYAINNDVVIYAITVGTDRGPIGFLPEYYGLSAAYETESMRDLAERTGGNFFYAPDRESLMATLDEFDFNALRGYNNINLSMISLFSALIIILIDWILINTIYRRVL